MSARSAVCGTEAILITIGDQHSAYERTAQFVAHVDRIRAENPGVPLAVLINGDSFESGNAVASRSAGEIEFAMFAALARRAPTILNLGNHEPEFYDPAATVERVRATGVTVVGNLRDKSSGELFAPASVRLSLGVHDVVVAGLTTDALSQYRAAVRPVLDLARPATWARQHFPDFFSGTNVAVVMSHAGLRHDRDVFPFVPNGALYLGAHDHTRYVQRLDRTVYVQSGSWNSHFSLVRLQRNGGATTWDVEQIAIEATDPADEELARTVQSVLARYAMPEDAEVIGTRAQPLARDAAARWVAELLRAAAGADAAFIGNTTFGDGVPAGAVTRRALDACVRFDGSICVAEVSGAELERWLASANQGPETPFAQRKDEFLFAVGPEHVDPNKTYRVATTDWGMRNRGRYFGREDLVFVERPELRLKAIVAEALSQP